MSLNFGLRFSLSSPTLSQGVRYQAEALAYFARMATDPGTTRKGLINTFITSLKSAGVWAKLDWLHLLASHEASTGLLNVKSSSWPLTASGSPSFTVDRGYQGDGVAAYLTVSGYDQSVSTGKNYALNSACAGAWVNAHSTPTTASSSPVIGTGGADGGPRLIPFSSANTAQGRINGSSSNVSATTGVSTNLGFVAGSRTNSANIDIYRSSTAINVTSASVGTGSAVNLLNQSSTLFSTARIAASFGGGGLTSTEMAALYNALNTYLTAIGAN